MFHLQDRRLERGCSRQADLSWQVYELMRSWTLSLPENLTQAFSLQATGSKCAARPELGRFACENVPRTVNF